MELNRNGFSVKRTKDIIEETVNVISNDNCYVKKDVFVPVYKTVQVDICTINEIEYSRELSPDEFLYPYLKGKLIHDKSVLYSFYDFVKCEKCGEMICDNCAKNIHIIYYMSLRTYFDDIGDILVKCDTIYDDNYSDVSDVYLCKKCAEARSDEIRREYNKSIEEAVNEFNRKVKKS